MEAALAISAEAEALASANKLSRNEFVSPWPSIAEIS